MWYLTKVITTNVVWFCAGALAYSYHPAVFDGAVDIVTSYFAQEETE